jgi:hypothetical protein
VPEARWHCPRAGDLAVRHWDDGTVVFDDSNGELQCLSPAFGALMEALITSPAGGTAGDLAESLIGETPTAEEVQMVENALSEFSNLRLVERTAT